jgi:hypothetical protein
MGKFSLGGALHTDKSPMCMYMFSHVGPSVGLILSVPNPWAPSAE